MPSNLKCVATSMTSMTVCLKKSFLIRPATIPLHERAASFDGPEYCSVLRKEKGRGGGLICRREGFERRVADSTAVQSVDDCGSHHVTSSPPLPHLADGPLL